MKFVWNLVLSRMKRQRKRLLFVLLAIAASSCLIVWMIGGFQALFIDVSTQNADYLGNYDLRIAAKSMNEGGSVGRGGGAAFGGPFAKQTQTSNVEKPNIQKEIATESDVSQDVDGQKRSSGEEVIIPNPDGTRGHGKSDANSSKTRQREGRDRNVTPRSDKKPDNTGRDDTNPDGTSPTGMRRGGSRGMIDAEFPQRLIAEIRADQSVSICDEVATLRMFVYSPGTEKSILEDADAEDEGMKPTLKRSLDLTEEEIDIIGEAPEGIDPELHRKAFGSYRATMGTPMGMGTSFYATSATEAPYELSDGRWFKLVDQNSQPREAVLTKKGNERLKAQIGDSLLLIDKSSLIASTKEYQLKVVGIVDDTETDGFYISRALAEELAAGTETSIKTSSLFLKIRGDVEEFRARWNDRVTNLLPTLEIVSEAEIVARKAAAFKAEQSFKFQAASGALLAALASLLIVFTALNTSVDEQKRLIAFYRVAGLTRWQVGLSILVESTVLAIPGWIAGMGTGWTLVLFCAGKATGLNLTTIGFSFTCTVVGAILAALYPIFRSVNVKPLDAISAPEKSFLTDRLRRRQTIRFVVAALTGSLLIGFDLFLVYVLPAETTKKAALHSGLGVLSLAVGVVCFTPLAIRIVEVVLLPVLATIFRFDSRMIRRELSGNASRVVTVAVALSVGGGLFVTMQIWGYSMLDPFLPGRRSPDAFAAFLPNGLRPEIIDELKKLPLIDESTFIPVAVEQAAFAEGSVPDDARKSQFANVVFFGVDVAKAFEGETPLIGTRFRQGKPEEAFEAMKYGRGVVVSDSLTVDYSLKLGDKLIVTHPREPGKTLEYPIVGVVSFPGWQWLSKTGGVRRNFGRSGGVVFAREGIIADDYQIERRSYFWFNAKPGEKIDYGATEAVCDLLARKNLKLDLEEKGKTQLLSDSQTAYVKLSTRESLTNSISRRADSVIWGLSKTPLTTLIIASIAVVGAIANSVRARRWQFGVMRAVGLTGNAIIRAILVEAILIGVVATITSFTFGFLAAQGALKLGRSMFGTVDPPLIIPVEGLGVGFVLTLALCLCAALYPAITTGRTETLKLLQNGRSPD